MKRKYLITGISLLCIALLIGLACSKSNNSSGYGGGGGNNPPPNSISIYNMAFSPASKTVKVGAIVKWQNNDSYAHTVTSNDGTTFDSGNISSNGTYSYTTTVAGTFDYHCTIHGLTMSGTIIVNP